MNILLLAVITQANGSLGRLSDGCIIRISETVASITLPSAQAMERRAKRERAKTKADYARLRLEARALKIANPLAPPERLAAELGVSASSIRRWLR